MEYGTYCVISLPQLTPASPHINHGSSGEILRQALCYKLSWLQSCSKSSTNSSPSLQGTFVIKPSPFHFLFVKQSISYRTAVQFGIQPNNSSQFMFALFAFPTFPLSGPTSRQKLWCLTRDPSRLGSALTHETPPKLSSYRVRCSKH